MRGFTIVCNPRISQDIIYIPYIVTASRLRLRVPLLRIINGTILDLPRPVNFSIWWNFGRLLGLVLGVQLVTGLFLAIHYSCDVDLAFSSVRHIFRDVNGG